MTIEQYEEFYCTYCDSQRCGDNPPETCPYWQMIQQINPNTDKDVDILINNITNTLADYSNKWRSLGTELLLARAEITDMAVRIIELEYEKYKAVKEKDYDYYIEDELGGIHTDGIGYAPDGHFCGECTHTTCKNCSALKKETSLKKMER